MPLEPKGPDRTLERLAACIGLAALAVLLALALTNHGCSSAQRIELAQAGRVFAGAACSVEPYLDAATATTGYHIVVHIKPGALVVNTSSRTVGPPVILTPAFTR